MYSLTSHRVLADKLPLLHRLEVAPAVVFDTPDSLSGDAVEHALSVASAFPDAPVVHLPFRDLEGADAPGDLARAASLVLATGFRVLLVHSFLDDAGESRLGAIRDLAQEWDAAVVVENTFERDLQRFAALLGGLGLAAVLDLHRLRLCGQSSSAWVEALGPLLWGLHAYGSTGEDEHLGVGPSDLDELRAAGAVNGRLEILLDVPRDELGSSARLVKETLGP